jgi:hypothetical protein
LSVWRGFFDVANRDDVGSGGMAYRACVVDMAEARTIRGMFWLKKALGLVAPIKKKKLRG